MDYDESNLPLPRLLKIGFSKWVFVCFLVSLAVGLLLFIRLPSSWYQGLLDLTSHILKTQYGTGGNLGKIDLGFHKLGFLTVVMSIAGGMALFGMKYLLEHTPRSTSLSVHPVPPQKFTPTDWWIVGGLTVAAALFRIFPLTQSLWLDEIGVYQTFMKPGIMATIFPKDSMGSQPLMQILVKLFTDIVGVNDITLRLPIFFFAVSSVPMIYYLAHVIWGNRAISSIAAFLLTFHSYHIYYSFQMRGYAIVGFLVIVIMLIFIKLLEQPKRKTAILLGALITLLLYTHLYTIFFWLALMGVIVVVVIYESYFPPKAAGWISRETLIEFFVAFLLSLLAIGILYLPQLPAIFMNIFNPVTSNNPYLEHLLSAIQSFQYILFYSDYKLLIYSYLGMVLSIFLALGKKHDKPTYLLCLSIFLFLNFVIFLPSGSAFFPRYLVPAIPLLLLLIASVTARSRQFMAPYNAIIPGFLIGGYCLLSIIGLGKSYQPIQNWKGAVEYVHQHASANSVTSANSLGKNFIKYYDDDIIPLRNVEQLNALEDEYDEVYIITTFEGFVGEGQFRDDAPTQQKLEKEATLVKTFHGEFPVNVFRLSKHGI